MYPGLPTNGSWGRRQTTAATAAVRPSNHVSATPTSPSDKKAFAHSAALDAAIAGLASASDMLIPDPTRVHGADHADHLDHRGAAAVTRASGAPLPTKPSSRRGSLFQIQVTRTSLETSSSHAASRSMQSSVAGGIDGSLYVPAATTGLIRPRAGQLLHRKSPRRLIHPVPESEPNDVDSILATARAGVAPGRADAESAAEDEDISVDPTKLDPYLQALAVVQFQPWIFFRELVVHWTPGAVLLTLFTRAGRIRAQNRAFFEWSFPCVMQWTFFAAFLVPMVLYGSGLAANWNIQMEEHINFCLIWLFRNAVVATKHAYTSPIEQAQMDEEIESREQVRNRQVLTAWHNPPSSVVELQILLASVRQSIDLTSGHFLLAPDDDDDDSHHPLARSTQRAAMPVSARPPLPPSPGSPDAPAPADPAAPALIYDLRVRYGAYLDKTTCSTATIEAGSLAPGACPLVSNAMGSPPSSPAPPDAPGPDDRHDASAPHLPPTSPTTTTVDGPPVVPSHSPPAGSPSPPAGASNKSPKRVSMWSVINDLVHESHGGPAVKPQAYLAAGFIYTMLPLLVRYCYNLPIMGGTDWAAILYTVCSMWITFMAMSSNYGFIVICIVDFHRREYLFRRLNAILWDGFVRQSEPTPPSSPSPSPAPAPTSPTSASPTTAISPDAPHTVLSEKTALVGDAAPPPPASPHNPCGAKPGLIRLDMSQSRNLLMWWYTRLILQDYGRAFLIRLSWYCGFFILYALIVGASVVANALGAFTIGPVGIVMGVFNLLTLLCALVNVLYHGMLVNDMRAAHVYTLIKRSVALSTRAERLARSPTTQALAADARRAADFCWVLSEACREDQNINALRVFGIPANIQVLGSFTGVMAAGLSAGLQALWNSRSLMGPVPAGGAAR
ncbi:hypothetical protein GGF31_002703 [Allomyces arbusculus]|nr:hypothetical protein GGF31_002703 [Allomyces arbusculus]